MDIPQFIDPGTLKNSCAYSAEEEVRIDFTEEELNAQKDDLFRVSFEKSKKEELAKAVSDAIKNDPDFFDNSWGHLTDLAGKLESTSSVKELATSFAKSMKNIHNGYEIRKEKVYGLDYQDEGVMAIYLSSGNLLYTRKLTPAERQTNIHSITRIAK